MATLLARSIPMLLLLVGPFLLVGCGSTGGATDAEIDAQQRSEVTGENLKTAKARSQKVEQLLIGRVAGVRVEELPGGGIRVTIRGPGTIYGDTSPLYIVDGMPVESQGGGLWGINPRDVESIRVLKNPADTAIYGVRGMNGVVLIRTIGASGRHGIQPTREG
ncbi:MAG: TonB-dependent receptor plug domain-containing protein [Bacteroidetes bacterium]|nr:TonB-dependent receptor plug domain-containing protein [Bacteroidota bacterium]